MLILTIQIWLVTVSFISVGKIYSITVMEETHMEHKLYGYIRYALSF